MRFYVIVSSFLILIFTISSIIAVLSRRGAGRIHVAFTLFAASVLLWCTPYLCWQLSTEAVDALRWCRWLVPGSILIPITYLNFVGTLTGNLSGRLLWACAGVALALLATSQTALIVARVEPRGGFDHWPVPGPAFAAYLLNFLVVTGIAFRLLLKRYQACSMQGRNQLKYLIGGTAIGFLGGSTNFFLWLNIPVPPIGQGLGIFYILGIGYSVIKFRLMEFNSMVVRVSGFLVALAVVAMGGALVTTWLWGVVKPRPSSPHLFDWWAMLMLAMLFIFPVMVWVVRRVENFVESRLVTRSNDYRSQLREVSAAIFNADDEGAIFRTTVWSLHSILRLQEVALFCRNEFEQRFVLREQIGLNLTDAAGVDAMLDLLNSHFEHRNDAASIEEILFENPGQGARDTAVFALDDLAVPIRAGGFLLGFVIIGLRNNRQIYSAIDVAVLEGIAFQLGLAIRARQLERQANQSEKLIALGTLAAGLAHEIRNPLVSIRTFSELIEEQGADSEFRWEFRGVVGRDVKRIGSIIDHVAAFAENSQVKRAAVHLAEVIAGVHDIARPEFIRSRVKLTVKETEVPPVKANYGQLIQVFLNIFQNAIQAMEDQPDSRIDVSFQLVEAGLGKRAVQVTISDNGPGIDDSVRTRIFDPFVTTKATGEAGKRRGMGLGLAIVKRIVDGHGGTIDVTSQPGKGTSFYVQFPCAEFS